MDEEAARAWLEATFDVSRETFARLEAFVALLAEENTRQNLVAAGTLPAAWSRHVADSAQLLLHAPADAKSWLDLGSGAGFPGLVVAILWSGEVTLLESRRLRTGFLERAATELGLGNVRVLCGRAETVVAGPFDVISARAFAPLPLLFEIGTRFAGRGTRWILPKGRKARSELEATRSSWQGSIRVEPSLTDAEAGIVVAERVRRRGQGATR
jgi:16S rRNA (guanine527-N7)-methyltransferase